MSGIISYGFYLPQYRIKIEEIAKVWGKNPRDPTRSLGLTEKAVASMDEDSLTMAYEASCMALDYSDIPRGDIDALFFGSETPPYAVNPASTILGEFLGIGNNYVAYDTQFACKAATGALITALSMVQTNATYALVCASDKATGKPHDALEYTAASGAVSLVVGKKNTILEVVDFESFSSDTPDFWRREGIRYPSHSGRFTGKPSYFYHIEQVSKRLLKKIQLEPHNFHYAVFHMPNGKFPNEIALSLGFTKRQIENSLVVSYLGNTYTASALMGLVSVLEVAQEGELIFFASYGSGAGSDGFVFRVTKILQERRREFKKIVDDKRYIDYTTYLKWMGNI